MGISAILLYIMTEIQIFREGRRSSPIISTSFNNESPNVAHHFNSQARNKLIKITKAAFVHAIFVLFTTIPFLTWFDFDQKIPAALFVYFMGMFEASIVVPSIVILQNPDILRFFWNEVL